MPLPLIPFLIVAGSAALGLTGAKKARDGYNDIADAKARGKKAEARHRKATQRVDSARTKLNTHASQFGEFKASLVSTTMSDVIEFLRKIERKSKSKSIEVLEEVGITREQFDSFRAQVLEAKTVFSGASAAVGAGAAAGQTVLAGVGLFGVASTGTAIAGLSGAAAQSATLAWLGGGALAAGGGGMAVGAAVLGGVVAGPAVFVMGFTLASQGEKAQTQIRDYERKVNVACKECDTIVDLLGQAEARIGELRDVMTQLDSRLRAALAELDAETWSEDSDSDIHRYQVMMTLARALGEVLRAPVLDDKGGIATESSNLRFKYRTLLT